MTNHKMEVSCFPNIKTTTNPKQLPMPKVLEGVKSGAWKDGQDKVRKLLAIWEADPKNKAKKDAYKRAKGEMPYMTASGTYTQRNNDSLVQHSGLLQVDLDGDDNPEWTPEKMRETIAADPYTYSAGISLSGDGVKAFALIPPDPEKHLDSFLTLQDHLRDTYGLNMDDATKDISRPCFVWHDPELVINDIDGVKVVEPQAHTPTLLPNSPDVETVATKNKKTARPIEDAVKALNTIKDALECPEYDDRLRILSGMYNTYGQAGYDAVQDVFGKDGFDKPIKHLTEKHTAGTVFFMAGKFVEAPEIHRNATDGKYWMQNTHTQDWHAVNMQEMKADLKAAGLSSERATQAIAKGRNEGSVDGVLQLAGRSRGIFASPKGKVLVPRTKYQIEPKEGEYPVTKALIKGMFYGEDYNLTQYDVFMSWMARAWQGYTNEEILVAQFLHIAGAAGSYKTYLVEHVMAPLFGQIAELNKHLVTDQQFNADLFKGFLWVADDPQLPRLGQVNHELIKAIAVSSQTCRCEGKNINAENTPALRRGIMLTNTGAEAMKVVPVFEDGMADKIISLYVHKFRLDVPGHDLPTESALIEALHSEAAAFAYALEQYDPPQWGNDNYADRYGVPSYKNPHVLAALRETSSAERNHDLMLKVVWYDYDKNPATQKTYTAAELLAAGSAAFTDGIVEFFGWESAQSLGRELAALEQLSHEINRKGKGTNTVQWIFTRPERSPFDSHPVDDKNNPF